MVANITSQNPPNTNSNTVEDAPPTKAPTEAEVSPAAHTDFVPEGEVTDEPEDTATE